MDTDEIISRCIGFDWDDGKRKHDAEIPADTRTLHILLVDDYETNRLLIKSFLKKTPYVVDEAVNGEEAFNKFRTGKYSIVLMDMQMPVMDGYTAAELIRRWERENNVLPTPIIALTAHAYKEDAEKAKASGCDLHLPKPIDMNGLLRAIYEMSVFATEVPETQEVRTKNVVISDIDLREVTERFLSDVNTFVIEICPAIEGGDFEKARGIGHKLKGIGGSFGFPFISKIGELLEISAQKEDAESLKEHSRALAEYMKSLEVRYE